MISIFNLCLKSDIDLQRQLSTVSTDLKAPCKISTQSNNPFKASLTRILLLIVVEHVFSNILFGFNNDSGLFRAD